MTRPRLHTRWAAFAVLCTVLLPLSIPGAASPLTALFALAAVLGLLAVHRRAFANWLIVLALTLLLLPALLTAVVLCQRLAGIPAMLSVWSAISQRTGIMAQAIVCAAEFASAVSLAWLCYAGAEAEIPTPPVAHPGRLRAPTVAAILAVWTFSMANFQLQLGASILSAGYRLLPTGNQLFYSGMWPSLGTLSLLLLELHARHWSTPARMLLNGLWAIQFLAELLHGGRAELLAGVFVLLLIRIRSYDRQVSLVLLGAIVGIPLLTFVAVFRQLAASGTVPISTMVSQSLFELEHFHEIGDLGDYAASTTSSLYMIESGRRPLLWGKTYLDYIPRLEPSAMRGGYHALGTTDLLKDAGLDTNGGGTVVSEAYMNFSWWGCLLVGLVNGWLIAWLHRRRLRTPSPLWVCLYTVAVAYTFRFYFYDSYDLIKIEFVFLLYFFAIRLLEAAGRPEPARVGTLAVEGR
ncbi:MAG: O-antigen polymerase [Terriglobales bacterium]